MRSYESYRRDEGKQKHTRTFNIVALEMAAQTNCSIYKSLNMITRTTRSFP